MRGWCPHCGELNEYTRPPTTAIVYCQHCRKPFGAAALSQTAPSSPAGGAVRTRSSSNPGGTPPSGVPRAPVSADPPTPGFAAPNYGNNKKAIAAQVIVPKSRTDYRGDGAAKVVYRSPDGLETEFILEDLNTIGRHPKNNIRLNDREISKEHAVIERQDDHYRLRDLRSSNGTYVNARRVSECLLKDGDEIQLGSMRLFFTIEKSGDTRTSVRDLVTILPQDPAGTTHIHAKLEDKPQDQDFRPVTDVNDLEVLKRDYEKLRLTHELSRVGLTLDLQVLLSKTLDVVFSILPADNGVSRLVDTETNMLVPHTVKQRQTGNKPQEILLSSTILNQVLHDRASVLSSDAFLDPRFSGSQSIISQGIRAAMCVPLVAQNKVVGVMHLDSRERVGAFTEKDLQLLKAIAIQTAITIENTRLVRQIEEEAKTRGQLSRFLPPHVVEAMVAGKGEAIQKGGRERQDATVLFSDIRGFTRLAEVAGGPQEVVDLLNDYFERLVEIVFKRQGVLDKFIGDALMATWGTLDRDDDATFNAVAAAIEFREAIRMFNDERSGEGKPAIGMGVGVNTGRLVAGYMGAKRRLEYTVIGDTVNTASRICGIAQAGQVLISDGTYQRVKERIEARYLGTRQVKGKETEVKIYEAIALKDGADGTP
jgi:adenylate cyclase